MYFLEGNTLRRRNPNIDKRHSTMAWDLDLFLPGQGMGQKVKEWRKRFDTTSRSRSLPKMAAKLWPMKNQHCWSEILSLKLNFVTQWLLNAGGDVPDTGLRLPHRTWAYLAGHWPANSTGALASATSRLSHWFFRDLIPYLCILTSSEMTQFIDPGLSVFAVVG